MGRDGWVVLVLGMSLAIAETAIAYGADRPRPEQSGEYVSLGFDREASAAKRADDRRRVAAAPTAYEARGGAMAAVDLVVPFETRQRMAIPAGRVIVTRFRNPSTQFLEVTLESMELRDETLTLTLTAPDGRIYEADQTRVFTDPGGHGEVHGRRLGAIVTDAVPGVWEAKVGTDRPPGRDLGYTLAARRAPVEGLPIISPLSGRAYGYVDVEPYPMEPPAWVVVIYPGIAWEMPAWGPESQAESSPVISVLVGYREGEAVQRNDVPGPSFVYANGSTGYRAGPPQADQRLWRDIALGMIEDTANWLSGPIGAVLGSSTLQAVMAHVSVTSAERDEAATPQDVRLCSPNGCDQYLAVILPQEAALGYGGKVVVPVAVGPVPGVRQAEARVYVRAKFRHVSVHRGVEPLSTVSQELSVDLRTGRVTGTAVPHPEAPTAEDWTQPEVAHFVPSGSRLLTDQECDLTPGDTPEHVIVYTSCLDAFQGSDRNATVVEVIQQQAGAWVTVARWTRTANPFLVDAAAVSVRDLNLDGTPEILLWLRGWSGASGDEINQVLAFRPPQLVLLFEDMSLVRSSMLLAEDIVPSRQGCELVLGKYLGVGTGVDYDEFPLYVCVYAWTGRGYLPIASGVDERSLVPPISRQHLLACARSIAAAGRLEYESEQDAYRALFQGPGARYGSSQTRR